MALFSSVVTKVVRRNILELYDKNPSFLPFVCSMYRNYGSLRNISQMKYAHSQMRYVPLSFLTFNNPAKIDIDVKHYSTGTKSNRSYYDVLGVGPNATQSQIKTAYYTLSKRHHPDTKTGDKENVIFLEVAEAYEVLGNLKKRKLYDRGVFRPNVHHDERDFKHEHETEEDSPKSGFQSPINQGIKRKKVYTGHTKIYNFDEHYRQHYSSLLNRQLRVKESIRKSEQALEERRLESQATKMLGLAISIFCVIVYIASSLGS